MKSLAVALAALSFGVAVSACGSTRVAATHMREGFKTASFPQYPLSFRYPAAWNRRDCPNQVTSFTDTVTYLTTARPGRCRGWSWSVKRLGKDGVLVAWVGFGMPGWTRITKFAGRDTRIGGRPARIAVTSVSSGCQRIGGTRSMAVAIKRDVPDNWMTTTVCLRGPNVGKSEAAVHQMLSTVHLG